MVTYSDFYKAGGFGRFLLGLFSLQYYKILNRNIMRSHRFTRVTLTLPRKYHPDRLVIRVDVGMNIPLQLPLLRCDLKTLK